ncbi:MAG: hypothetical protein WBG05_04200 [Thermoanaerobaculia bacterium]
MKKTLVFVWIMLTLIVGVASAEKYRVTVTREGSNLYRVVGTDTYVKTRYCYAYVYYEDALVDTDEMMIYFLDSDDECEVEKII